MKNYKNLIANLRSHAPSKDDSLRQKITFWLLTIIVGGGLLGVILAALSIGIISITLPDVSSLDKLAAAQSTEIYDKEGGLLYTIHGEENREYVPLSEVSETLTKATVAIEDDEFFEHGGFDLPGIAKAVIYELTGVGTPRGGSTITQQYVKNTFLSAQRSYIRKLKELILAIRLERTYDKDKILELYLNRIPYGNNAYGIQKASEIYFNKNAKDLTLAESAILAGLPQAPSRYNPYGNNKYSHLLKTFSAEELELRKIKAESDLKTEEYVRGCLGQMVDLGNGEKIYIKGRSDIVLARMEELGKITHDERQQAVNELQTITFNTYREKMKAPHFVFYIKQILEEKYGKDVVETGGLKVYTTLDPEIQEHAEKVALERGKANESTYGANNIAVLTADVKTGQILAMVGSRDYFDTEIDGNVNVVMRSRQPGSSFKPIVYAQAFYNGYGPGSVTYDVPMNFGADSPQNFDGKFMGRLTLRTALGQSRNIPAIQAYFLAGQQNYIIDLASRMGITTLDKNHQYGYPLALGAGEIPLYQMVQAYTVFANNGKKIDLNAILKIENSKGDVLEEYKPKTENQIPEVLDPQIAFLINSILSDDSIKLGQSLIISGRELATKTGTSTKESKQGGTKSVAPGDGWIIGYTPQIIVGVWGGNTRGEALKLNATGEGMAGYVFQTTMAKALSSLPAEPFPIPTSVKKIAVSTISGLLPGPNTPQAFIKEDYFASFAVPTEIDNSFIKVQVDKISGKLATEFTPKDAIENILYIKHTPLAPYDSWASAIQKYYQTNEETFPEGIILGEGLKIASGNPPTEYDDIHTSMSAENMPTVTITNPSANETVEGNSLEISIKSTSPNGLNQVEYYIDDELKVSSESDISGTNLRISPFLKDGKGHLVKVKVIDKLGYSATSVVEVKFK